MTLAAKQLDIVFDKVSRQFRQDDDKRDPMKNEKLGRFSFWINENRKKITNKLNSNNQLKFCFRDL